jgi:hypothetical protein
MPKRPKKAPRVEYLLTNNYDLQTIMNMVVVWKRFW